MKRSSFAAALHKRQNGVLVAHALFDLDATLAANECLVNLNDLTRAAHGSEIAIPQRFADAMA